MSNVPERDEKRDKDLIAEYQLKNEAGAWVFTATQIAAHFNMSATRLYQILDYYKIQRRSKNARQHRPRAKKGSKPW